MQPPDKARNQSADHSPISRPDKPSAVPGVQPLDAVALRSRSLDPRRPGAEAEAEAGAGFAGDAD